MPELTQAHKDFAIFMETYVEPLFIIPASFYYMIVGVTNWGVGSLLPLIQTLISAWTG